MPVESVPKNHPEERPRSSRRERPAVTRMRAAAASNWPHADQQSARACRRARRHVMLDTFIQRLGDSVAGLARDCTRSHSLGT